MFRIRQAQTRRDLVTIHRLHRPLLINYLCYAIWGAGFAATEPAQVLAAPVLAAVIANVLLIVAGLGLNNVVDVRSDTRNVDKKYQASAVQRIGGQQALGWFSAEAATAIVLTIGIGVATGRWMSLLAALAIVILQVLYNTKPVYLKNRGFTGTTAFGLCVPGLPCLLSYGAVRADLTPAAGLIFTGLAIMSIGRTTWWSVPDHYADATAGIDTPTVRYGPRSALLASCSLMTLGTALAAAGIWWWSSSFALAVVGIAIHAFILVASVLPLVRDGGRDALPSSRWLRTRVLPLVTIGEAVIVVVALIGRI